MPRTAKETKPFLHPESDSDAISVISINNEDEKKQQNNVPSRRKFCCFLVIVIMLALSGTLMLTTYWTLAKVERAQRMLEERVDGLGVDSNDEEWLGEVEDAMTMTLAAKSKVEELEESVKGLSERLALEESRMEGVGWEREIKGVNASLWKLEEKFKMLEEEVKKIEEKNNMIT